jgi:hypothetical protein
VILAAIAIQVIIVPNYLVSLAVSGNAGQASAEMLSDQYGMMMIIRWLLTLCGGLLLVFAAWKQLQGAQPFVKQQEPARLPLLARPKRQRYCGRDYIILPLPLWQWGK